jgi:hypothetical protein
MQNARNPELGICLRAQFSAVFNIDGKESKKANKKSFVNDYELVFNFSYGLGKNEKDKNTLNSITVINSYRYYHCRNILPKMI